MGHTTKLFLPCLSLYQLKLPNFSFENFISNSFLRKTELNLSNRFQIESLEMTWYKLKLRKSLFSITLWLNMRLILFSVHVKCVKSWDLLSVRILSNHILSVSFRTFQEREVIPFSFFSHVVGALPILRAIESIVDYCQVFRFLACIVS